MYQATSFIVVVVLLTLFVLHTEAQFPRNNWAQPYQRVYDDDADDLGFSFSSLGLCLISPVVAFKLGVIRGEEDNENDGVIAFSVRECALRALTCGGITNTDCSSCLQLETTACTSINGCTASVGYCTYTCPVPWP